MLMDGNGGVIRLGLGYAPNAMFAGPLLRYMLQQHPRVALHLSTGNPEAQLAALRTREFDALLVHSRAVRPQEDLQIDLIGTVQSAFMCRVGHPLAGRKRVGFPEIVDYPVISTMLSDEATRILVQRFGPAAHLSRLLRASSDSVSALIEAVLATDAIFLGAVGAARGWIESGDIQVVAVDTPLDIDAPYAFVTLSGRTHSPMLGTIQDFCSSLVAKKVGRLD
jgi:DNA-binding transcriptional LysR family regulator